MNYSMDLSCKVSFDPSCLLPCSCAYSFYLCGCLDVGMILIFSGFYRYVTPAIH